MCVVKKPKVVQPEQKDPPILRNPYLDGIDPIIRATQGGTRSLRIDRSVTAVAPSSLKIARGTNPTGSLQP